MDELLGRLNDDFPELTFEAGKAFYWSPADRRVVYDAGASGITAVFSVLHEVGHGLLAHKRFTMDFELLSLEVAAWERAKDVAGKYGLKINEDHIQDCLDSYRDWLYRRSICPSCTTKSPQLDRQPSYRCFNCRAVWKVAPSRFCRPYRQTARSKTTA